MEVETFPTETTPLIDDNNNNDEKIKTTTTAKGLRPRRTLAEVLWDDLYILMHYFTPLLVIYNLSW